MGQNYWEQDQIVSGAVPGSRPGAPGPGPMAVPALPTPTLIRGKQPEAKETERPATDEEMARLQLSPKRRWVINAQGVPRDVGPSALADQEETTKNAEAKVTQDTAAGYYSRALNAHTLYGPGVAPLSLARVLAIKQMPPEARAYQLSPEERAAYNYADEFIRAKLRKESGAAIPAEEMAQEYPVYFPQPGEGPEDIERKRQIREQAIEGLRIPAGPAAEKVTITGGRQVGGQEILPATGASIGPQGLEPVQLNLEGLGGEPRPAGERLRGGEGPGDIGFNTPEGPQYPPGAEEVHSALTQAINAGQIQPTAESVNAWLADWTRQHPDQPYEYPAGDMANLLKAIQASRDTGQPIRMAPVAPLELTPEEQAQVDKELAETGTLTAAGRGAVTAIPFVDEVGNAILATVDAMQGEGSFAERYQRNKMINDETWRRTQEEHPKAYTGGQIAGALTLPSGVANAGKAAAVAAIRNGATRAEAIQAASRATFQALTKEGTAYGAAVGAGEGEGWGRIGSAATGATIGAVTAATGGKAAEWGGSKLAAAAERRAATQAAADRATQSWGGPPLEPPAATLTPAEKYARAQRQNIDLSIGDVRGMGAKILERGLDIQPGSAELMNVERRRLGEQVGAQVKRVAGTYGGETDFRGIGEAVAKGRKDWGEVQDAAVRTAYNAVPIKGDSPAVVDNTLAALRELTGEFQSNPELRKHFADTDLDAYLTALSGKNEPLNWTDLKTLRTKIGREMRRVRFQEGADSEPLERLYGALSEDMKANARRAGPDALAKFEAANQLYKEGRDAIEGAWQKILGKREDDTPEKVAARFQEMVRSGRAGGNLKVIQDVWKMLPEAQRGEVANGLIQLLGQPANAKGREWTARAFMTNFQNMDEAAKNLIFGAGDKALRKNLDEFVGTVSDIAGSNATRNTSWTAPAGLAALHWGNLFSLAAHAGTTWGAGKLWTNPGFVRWATGYNKMMRAAAKSASGDPTPQAFTTQVRLLDRLIAKEPTIAAEASGFRDSLTNAISENLGVTDQEGVAPPERKRASAR